MKRIFLLMLVTMASQAPAQKPRSYQAVTEDLANKTVQAPLPKTPVSLAVVPFAASQSSTEKSTAFGAYLTETIIGLLANHPAQLKLFERTRMDAILTEHAFILTDLMKPAAALKIGQLAPIDALLSGTYTRLKSYVDISARLIDVSSGEILMSFNGRIKVNKNLSTLFSSPTPAATEPPIATQQIIINNTVQPGLSAAPKSREEICKEQVAAFRPRLNDLSSEQKIEAVVREAMQTPFDLTCGKLHFDVMYAFTRFNIASPRYETFLQQTLDTIAFPSADDRAIEIVRFLSHDGDISESEWAAGFHCVARVGNYWLSVYLDHLLANTPKTPASVARQRIDNYFQLASNQRLGLPRPISFEMAFIEMMEGLKRNQALRQYTYETYAPSLAIDGKLAAVLFGELTSMYREEADATKKTKVMRWVTEFIRAHRYEKAADQVYDFVYHFAPVSRQRTEEDRRLYPDADLAVLIQACSDQLATYALATPYPSQKEDRIAFCARHNIAIPGVIPTLDEAAAILKGSDLAAQLNTMKLLVLRPEPPRQLEGLLVGLFDKRSLEDRAALEEAQTLAIQLLGDLRTTNSRAIAYMLSVLPHYGNDTEAAEEALVKIGQPAVGAVIARLDRTNEQEGGLQYQLITILGKIGKPAAPAAKSIARIRDSTRNSAIRYAAEAALQSIR
jgi:TolB-like protein